MNEKARKAARIAVDMERGTYEYPNGGHRGPPDPQTGRYKVNKSQIARDLEYADYDSASTLFTRAAYRHEYEMESYRRDRQTIAALADLNPLIRQITRQVIVDLLHDLTVRPNIFSVRDRITIAKEFMRLNATLPDDAPRDEESQHMTAGLIEAVRDKLPEGVSIDDALADIRAKQLTEGD
jgi:hypothetical protein